MTVVSQKQMTLKQFASVLPGWYIRFMVDSKYCSGYIELLDRFALKIKRCGYLDVADLCDIADWGGNQNGVKGRLSRRMLPKR